MKYLTVLLSASLMYFDNDVIKCMMRSVFSLRIQVVISMMTTIWRLWMQQEEEEDFRSAEEGYQ